MDYKGIKLYLLNLETIDKTLSFFTRLTKDGTNFQDVLENLYHDKSLDVSLEVAIRDYEETRRLHSKELANANLLRSLIKRYINGESSDDIISKARQIEEKYKNAPSTPVDTKHSTLEINENDVYKKIEETFTIKMEEYKSALYAELENYLGKSIEEITENNEVEPNSQTVFEKLREMTRPKYADEEDDYRSQKEIPKTSKQHRNSHREYSNYENDIDERDLKRSKYTGKHLLKLYLIRFITLIISLLVCKVFSFMGFFIFFIVFIFSSVLINGFGIALMFISVLKRKDNRDYKLALLGSAVFMINAVLSQMMFESLTGFILIPIFFVITQILFQILIRSDFRHINAADALLDMVSKEKRGEKHYGKSSRKSTKHKRRH